MGRVQDLVDDVRTQGAFDTTDPVILRALTRRHRKMVVRSRIRRATLEIGPTVANDNSYVLPAHVAEVLEVTVNGMTWGRGRHSDLAAGAQGWILLSGPGGLVAPDEDTDGARSLALYPTPTEAGLSIKVHATLKPTLDLSVSDDTTLLIPDDYDEALLAGGISALMLSNIGDFRADIARDFEQQFVTGCDELRRDVAKQYRGSGPAQIRVQGINA